MLIHFCPAVLNYQNSSQIKLLKNLLDLRFQKEKKRKDYSFDSAIKLLGIYFLNRKTLIQKAICLPMFITVYIVYLR